MREPGTGIHPPTTAEILLWQSRIRVAIALLAGGTELLLQRVGLLHGSSVVLARGLVAYLAIIGLLWAHMRRARRAGGVLVATTIAADLMFIFWTTLVSSPPAYYDRTLVLSFFILYLTEFYFGRARAMWALAAVAAGYLTMVRVMLARGVPLDWPEEVWSIGVFTLVGLVFILQYGTLRARLRALAGLFAKAEEGDFAAAYDERHDGSPDSITMVGRAYNRVRLQLAEMVLTDPLTGCLNRRGFEQELSRAIGHAVRSGEELALLALDLDLFKRINDEYGHLAGDAVLREVGALLRAHARTGDTVARTGGEEFMVILVNTGLDEAAGVADRLAEAFRGHQFDAVHGRARVTASIGLAADRPRDENVGRALHARADEALYAAKRAGRDRVCVWSRALHVLMFDERAAAGAGDGMTLVSGGYPAIPPPDDSAVSAPAPR